MHQILDMFEFRPDPTTKELAALGVYKKNVSTFVTAAIDPIKTIHYSGERWLSF